MNQLFDRYGFWISLVLIVAVVYTVLSAWGVNLSSTKIVADKPNITLAHIDKDGTMWVEIKGNLYYLCLSDNGTQEELKWKK
jgi:hypothetical protein